MIRGLYCIADNSLTPHLPLVALAQSFLAGGARIIQLRDKLKAQVEAAHQIAALRREHPFCFIVNDHVDLALEAGADGVHLGADDMPVAKARRRLGRNILVGYSSHSLAEALAAEAAGADYIAFGAIFPTATKGPGHPIQGVGQLTELCQALKIPVVAIGGINRTNVRQVIDAGASAFALISGIVLAPDIAQEVSWYQTLR